jgi:hypothetical protein
MKNLIKILSSYWYLILIFILSFILLSKCSENKLIRDELDKSIVNYESLKSNTDELKNECYLSKVEISELITSRDSLENEISKLVNKNTKQVTYVSKIIRVTDTIEVNLQSQIELDTCIIDEYRSTCISLCDSLIESHLEIYSKGFLTVDKVYLYPEGLRKWYLPWTWRRRKVPSFKVIWHEDNPYIITDKVQSIELIE